MQTYRVVGGVAVIGLGEVVGISEAQFDARAHNVDVVRRVGKRVDVRARVPLEFKDGEIIVFHGEPPKNAAHLLVAEGKGEKQKPVDKQPPPSPPAAPPAPSGDEGAPPSGEGAGTPPAAA